jgi:hypothetical protein
MAGHYLVAGRYHNQPVKLVGLSHDLNGVFDQFATGQRVSHAPMAHGNTVADAYGLEFEGHSSGRAYARLHSLTQLVKVNMPGYKLIIRVDNAYEGTANLFVA